MAIRNYCSDHPMSLFHKIACRLSLAFWLVWCSEALGMLEHWITWWFLGLQVVFLAERDIFPGEEITYDYHFNHEDEGKKIPCFCKSKNCRRFLNWDNINPTPCKKKSFKKKKKKILYGLLIYGLHCHKIGWGHRPEILTLARKHSHVQAEVNLPWRNLMVDDPEIFLSCVSVCVCACATVAHAIQVCF